MKDDLISRQAALKELAVYIHLIDKTMGKGTLTDDDCMESAKSVLGEDELPAVQPDHVADVSKKVDVDDLISRRAVIDAVSEYATFWMSYTDDMSASDIAQEAINSAKDTMIRILKEQPTIQPETATITIGRTKGGVVMWYECDACGESINQKDCYCRNCGRKLKYE